MKKMITTILSAVILTTSVPVLANDDITVKIDDKPLTFEVQPQIIDGNTMVPMRTIFESLGYTVEWDGENQNIIASNQDKDKEIFLTIGMPGIIFYSINELMYVPNTDEAIQSFIDKNYHPLEVAPIIIDGSTLVPVRAVSEASGYDVLWDGDKKSVLIRTQVKEDETQIDTSLTEKNINTPIQTTKNPNSIDIENQTIENESAFPYYDDIDLYDYGAFSGGKVVHSDYGSHYLYDKDTFNGYEQAIEADGWTRLKKMNKDDYIFSNGEDNVRILWGSNGVTIVTNEEYFETKSWVINKKSGERIQNIRIVPEDKDDKSNTTSKNRFNDDYKYPSPSAISEIINQAEKAKIKAYNDAISKGYSEKIAIDAGEEAFNSMMDILNR